MIRHLLLPVLLAALGVPALAKISPPDGAALRFEAHEDLGSYALPIGPHDGDRMATVRAEGEIDVRAYRLGGTGLSSYQIMLGFRQQLEEAGYDILFECDEESCGGYAFRFDTRIVQEPEMHVDLGDFHFLSAHVPGDSGLFASVLVSRSPSAGFIQVIEVSPPGQVETPDVDVSEPELPADTEVAVPEAALGEVGTAMETVGRYVLTDLEFETGSTTLGGGTYDSLADLATYLETHPDARVALVGHTDAQGGLAPNIAISKGRATSVRDRLVADYGVDPARLEAEGIGYLSPLATNQTAEGRTQNRRVEAILVTTQ
jgi:OOP family OmpA-OmpF porin